MNIFEAFTSGYPLLRRQAWCEDQLINLPGLKNDRLDFSREDILANDWEIVRLAQINCVDLRRAWSKALSTVSMNQKDDCTNEEMCKIMNYNYEVYKNLEMELGLKKP